MRRKLRKMRFEMMDRDGEAWLLENTQEVEASVQ